MRQYSLLIISFFSCLGLSHTSRANLDKLDSSKCHFTSWGLIRSIGTNTIWVTSPNTIKEKQFKIIADKKEQINLNLYTNQWLKIKGTWADKEKAEIKISQFQLSSEAFLKKESGASFSRCD